ncbi:MAG: glutamate--tRNA ligase [Hyphomicrobiaceae bacterium]|nr:glutamate--tRNA ligase [Hyphomicrobiaceae bacterium]MCC0024568.1 glutamate--tRNA ligase [Hyphomicrobiaceae bacterium]
MTRVRFAPSPTGLLHIGNARLALINWLCATKTGGTYILRLDDTDLERSKPEFAEAIAEDLAWLGITPGETYRQSDRLALYDAARDRLIESGHLYACYETPDELDRRRKRALALGRPPIYDRAALDLTDDQRATFEAEGRRPHWRFKLKGDPVTFIDQVRGSQTVNTSSMSDPVLIREDGTYLYTFTSVVDDIDLAITHIIRGEDHISNSGVQIEIFEALGAEAPAFGHVNLLTDAEGKGLSKRLGSLSLSELRSDGYEPLAVAIIASLTGTSLNPEPYPDLDAVAGAFSLDAISHGPARYDPSELQHLNARILHEYPFEAIKERLAEFGVTDPDIWEALKHNLTRLSELTEWLPLVHGPVSPQIDADDREFINQARNLLPQEPWDGETWKAWTDRLKLETGRKGKSLFLPLRLALTGRPDGPELKSLLPLIGRKASLDRLA